MTARFSNRKASIIWVFAGCWLSGLVVGTALAIRDGIPPDSPRWLVFLAGVTFWTFGIWLIVYVSRQPCVTVSVLPGGKVRAILRYPFRAEVRDFGAAEVLPLQIIESEDQDGDPYFRLRLPISMDDGNQVVFAEGSFEHCRETEATFLAALARLGSQGPFGDGEAG